MLIKKILFLLLSSLIAASCYESKNPLGKIDNSIFDKNLIGLWEFQNKLSDGRIEKGYFLIQKGIKNYYQIFTQDSLFKFNNSLYSNFQGYITKINKKYYLNLLPLQIIDGKHIIKDTKNYIFANYSIRKNKLYLRLFDTNYIKKSIKKKIITGEIDDRKFIKIKASSKKMKKIIKKHEKKILQKKTVVLRKLRVR